MCDTICNAIYGDKDTQYVPNLTMSFMILRLWVNMTYDIDLEHINWIGGGQVLGGKHDIKESRRQKTKGLFIKLMAKWMSWISVAC